MSRTGPISITNLVPSSRTSSAEWYPAHDRRSVPGPEREPEEIISPSHAGHDRLVDRHLGPRRAGRGVWGTVGSRLLGHLRLFRYEVRRWREGSIPDVAGLRAGTRAPSWRDARAPSYVSGARTA